MHRGTLAPEECAYSFDHYLWHVFKDIQYSASVVGTMVTIFVKNVISMATCSSIVRRSSLLPLSLHGWWAMKGIKFSEVLQWHGYETENLELVKWRMMSVLKTSVCWWSGGGREETTSNVDSATWRHVKWCCVTWSKYLTCHACAFASGV